MPANKKPMTPKQALSIAVEAIDEELRKLSSSWTGSLEDKTWRNEFAEAKKVLSDMKLDYESEEFMIYDAQKGTIKGTKSELKQLIDLVVSEVRSKIQADVKQVMAAERTKVFKQKPNPFYSENPQGSFQNYVNGKGVHK